MHPARLDPFTAGIGTLTTLIGTVDAAAAVAVPAPWYVPILTTLALSTITVAAAAASAWLQESLRAHRESKHRTAASVATEVAIEQLAARLPGLAEQIAEQIRLKALAAPPPRG